MIRFRTLKNSYSKIKENYTYIITEEEAEQRYWTRILDEAIRSFEKNPVTISLEEWHDHMRREYNIVL